MLPLRRSLASLAVLVVLAGCGVATPTTSPASPSPSPSPQASPSPSPSPLTPEEAYRQIRSDVEQIRGLQPTKDVEPEVLDPDELAAYVDRLIAEITDEEWRTSDALLRHLGLIPTEETLEELFDKLLSSQTAGFYDPEASRLVVRSTTGAIGPVERVTLAHELTHMLQDQHFDLVKLDSRGVASGLIREAEDRNDRHLGLLALTEGDATTVMFQWAQQRLTPAELLGLSAADPEGLEILNSMPLILRETLLYPYTTGLQFAFGLQAAGGWDAIDEAYANPPSSTEQILHPEKFVDREEPVAVDLPDDLAARLGEGWKRSLEDTFGEFDTRIWLQDVGGLAQAQAEAAAAGWGGDRLALLEGPEGAWAIAWSTRWDSPAEAAEFVAGAQPAVARLDAAAVLPGEGGSAAWVVVGSDAATLGRVANVLGLAG